jgi:hypothetical protein
MVPLPVPGEGDGDAATEYIYRVRRDAEARTVIVERLKVEP